VSDLNDKKLIKKETYIKTEMHTLVSSIWNISAKCYQNRSM